MKKTRISETQIIRTLKGYESEISTEIILREYEISRATLYLWKKNYSGEEVSLDMLVKLTTPCYF